MYYSLYLTPIDCACSSGDIPNMMAFDKNGLKVVFSFQRSMDPTTPAMVSVTLYATNSTPLPITEFVFQCAVPKVCVCAGF